MRPSEKPIVVIGSINMDLVVRTDQMPRPGQTVPGTDFVTVPGGKGANQAVAAAKLGADVHFVGRVGRDDFGDRLLEGLKQNGVGTRHVLPTPKHPSGTALIIVDAKGENSIVVAGGSNQHVTPADVDAAKSLIAEAGCVMLQLEIPRRTVLHTIRLCRKLGVQTILDPAPAPGVLPASLYGVDLFSPNEHEAEQLLGMSPVRTSGHKQPDPLRIASDLLARGARSVVLKLGSRGSMYLDASGVVERAEPFRVKVIDTTAAGDAFTAGLAVARVRKMPPAEMLRFANAAGALSCTVFGAQPSLPSLLAVRRLMARR